MSSPIVCACTFVVTRGRGAVPFTQRVFLRGIPRRSADVRGRKSPFDWSQRRSDGLIYMRKKKKKYSDLAGSVV